MNIEEIDALRPENLNGMLVKCKGFCMLAKLNDGEIYRMELFRHKYHGDCITFYKPRGKNPLAIHRSDFVIGAIQNASNGSLNGLEII